MFTPADQRARFADKARDYSEPRPEDAMNAIATYGLVQSVAGLKVWFVTHGLEAEFLGALEGIFEAIGEYPLPEPTNWMTQDHAALSRMYRSARDVWQASRKTQGVGEAA